MTPPGKSTSAADKARRPRARRAVSDSAKAERRIAILTAAEQHLRDAGFEAFSMEALARRLVVARGTLYRYFATREEVLLQLYLLQRSRFAASLRGEIVPGMNDDAFVECWFRHATADPLFLMLQARLGSVIEHNITLDRLIEAKLAMRAEMDAIVDYLAARLALDADRSERLIVALVAVLLGATELDNSPQLADLPPGIAGTTDLFARERVFTDSARLILAGLRREGGAPGGHAG